jgi:hypothetical protein
MYVPDDQNRTQQLARNDSQSWLDIEEQNV